MKAKTKYEIRVKALSDNLKPLSPTQRKWAESKIFKVKYFVKRWKSNYCLECGFKWKSETHKINCTCPRCQSKLSVYPYDKLFHLDYFSIFSVVDGLQVIRIFEFKKLFKPGFAPVFSVNEIVRHFVDERGRVCTLTKPYFSSYYAFKWYYDKPFEIKKVRSLIANDVFSLYPDFIYPRKSILPELSKRGFSGNFFDAKYNIISFFDYLFNDTKFETLIKLNQHTLIKNYSTNKNKIYRFWRSILIAHKNNYKYEVDLWFDYLDILFNLNLDTHNPFYICPSNLNEAHHRYLLKFERLKNKDKLKQEVLKYQNIYIKEKGIFFDFTIESKEHNLTIVPLKTIEDFFNEGTYLQHCVFTNEYYKKNSLILSARDSRGNPIETIEISLDTFELLQSRGMLNNFSELHDVIVKLTKNHIHHLKKIYSSKLNKPLISVAS